MPLKHFVVDYHDGSAAAGARFAVAALSGYTKKWGPQTPAEALAMKPIVTLTLNPAIDASCQADEIHPIHKIRTSRERYDPGGGGIIRELGGEALAVDCTGGLTGHTFNLTRASHNVFERRSGQEFRFVPEGPALAAEEWPAVRAELETFECNYLVASGSLPQGVSDDFHAGVAGSTWPTRAAAATFCASCSRSTPNRPRLSPEHPERGSTAMSQRLHRTKIIATIGPASSARGTLERMIEAGMNVARLNFAHGAFESHAETIATIRAAARAVGRRVAILADLPGPKLRIGPLAQSPLELQRDQRFTLSVGEFTGDATRASTTFAGLPQAVTEGDLIFLNDGLVQLRVERVDGQDVHCVVGAGGLLLSNKGINLPDLELPIDAFTERDRKCLEFAVSQGIDAIGQSFVQTAADILAVRAAAREFGGQPLVFAKIERSTALQRIDEILEAADGIMVARGDLGVEIPIERIAVAQKELIRKANLCGKPAITATQMLLSMVGSRRPTRAESTDVANAILDGTDCVMLSEESAMGDHPVDAVEMLARIAEAAEPRLRPRIGPEWEPPQSSEIDNQELIAACVAHVAARVAPLGIFVPTETGATVRRIAAFRLPVWITAVSRFEQTCQNLQFIYGVRSLHLPQRPDSWPDFTRKHFHAQGPGRILMTEGPAGPGGTNRLEIIDV